MIKDEFNQVEIKNEKEIFKVEFGKTQKNEATSQKDNELPNSDLNEKYIGKTVKKVADVNVEYTNKIQSNTATVVKGATTATNVAATAASTVVVASTVAVAGFAIATGITFGIDRYKYDFDSFVITSTEVFYRLTLEDKYAESKDDYYQEHEGHYPRYRPIDEPYEEQVPFILRVYNSDYDYSNYLWYGQNEGSFSNLTLGKEYNIVLSENKVGGEVIYQKSFTTYENSEITSAYLDSFVDLDSSVFHISINYVDELNVLEDFSLVMTPTKGDNKEPIIFPLEKTDYQEVNVNEYVDPDHPFDFYQKYNYHISYRRGEGTYTYPRLGEETVSFYVYEREKTSEIYNATLFEEADFVNKTIQVQLDFIDELGQYSNFALVLTDLGSTNEVFETYPLEKTTDVQTITLNSDSEIDLRHTIQYQFVYLENGEQKNFYDEEQIINFTGPRSEIFDAVLLENANFLNRTVEVILDFVDDLDQYSDFKLVLMDDELPDEIIETYLLDETTDTQTISLGSDSSLNLNRTIRYRFTYVTNGEELTIKEDTINFEDNSGAIEEFTGVIFDKTINFIDKTFNVAVEYTDELGYFSAFTFILEDLDETSNPVEFLMSNDEQTLTIDADHEINIEHHLHYSFRYYDERVGEEVTIDGEDFYFENNAFTFESSLDFTHDASDPTGGTGSDIGDSEPVYMLPAKLTFDSRYEDLNGLEVQLLDENNEALGWLACVDDPSDSRWHYYIFNSYSGDSIDVVMNKAVTIEVTILNSEEERLTIYHKTVNFTKDETTQIFDLFIDEPNVIAGDYLLMYRPIYSGNSEDIIDPELVIETSDKTYTYSIFLNGLNGSDTIALSNPIEMNFDETTVDDEFSSPVKISVIYHTSSGDEVSIVCYEALSIMIEH